MMKRRGVFVLAALAALALGCRGNTALNPKDPVRLTMWHNYGGVLQETMDELIDEFNQGAGRKKGVIINVTAVSAARELNGQLQAIAAGDPGAPSMPDLVTAYPAVAMVLAQAGLLAPLDGFFSQADLAAYVPRFVEEGRLDGRLFVFPTAKSTEALFVNKVFFDRFIAAAGGSYGELASFEGIAALAERYLAWTDSLTPAPGDGRAFFTADSWFNLALVGSAQLGVDFAGSGGLATDTAAFRRVWDVLAPAFRGAYALSNAYSSDLSRTGEIVCSLGSTAGVLFYGDTVVYPDNTSEAVEYLVLPYPVFSGGKKAALQRGAGMVVAASTPRREEGAAFFLRWFTAPEVNMRFVASTGYLPVSAGAFGKPLAESLRAEASPVLRHLMETAAVIYGDYEFVIPPNIEGMDLLSRSYEAAIRGLLAEGRRRVSAGEDLSAVRGELFASLLK
jgi:multiple sugar transport system substrate-binding protein